MVSKQKAPEAVAPRHRDPEVVRKAEAIFAEMGMTPEEAVGIFYKQTALHGKFPITELIPNETMQAALREPRENLVRYASVAEFRAELDEIMSEVDDEESGQNVQLSA